MPRIFRYYLAAAGEYLYSVVSTGMSIFTGLLSPSSQRSHHKKLNLRMKSFSVDSDNPPTAPAAPIDKTTKSKSHSSSSFTNLLGGGLMFYM